MALVPFVTIHLGRGVLIPIHNVADAASALHDERWPHKGSALHRKAVRTVGDALAGHCKVRVALEAFRKAADEAGVIGRPGSAKK
jgi:hypothetical protein